MASMKEVSPGKWKLRFDGPKKNGKRNQEQRTFEGNKRAATAELARLQTEVAQGTYHAPTKVTVGEALLHWLETARATTTLKTHEEYGKIVHNYLVPALGHRRLDELHPQEIQDYANRLLQAGGEHGKPLSRSTVKAIIGKLRQSLELAVDQEIIPRNPARKVKLPAVTREEIRVFARSELQALLDGTTDSQFWIAFVLAAAIGGRRGEYLALRWSDVDLEATPPVATIARSLEQTSQGLRFKEVKTASGRRQIALPAFAVEALIKHRAAQAAHRLRTKGYKDQGLICCGKDGSPLNPSSVGNTFLYHVKRLGLPRLSLHKLRHTYASQSLREGADMLTVSKMLGHSSVGITMGIYTHAVGDEQARQAARIDRILRSGGE